MFKYRFSLFMVKSVMSNSVSMNFDIVGFVFVDASAASGSEDGLYNLLFSVIVRLELLV